VTRDNGSARKGKPKLGQHFLRDPEAVIRIVEALGDISKSTVVEIGPGPGGLTRALLALGAARVIAVERDQRAIAGLKGGDGYARL